MMDGMLAILLDIGSNINIIGLKTAQTFERVSRSHGHDIKKLNLSKRLYVSGVGHGAAACGAPATGPRLDTYSANAAEGSGESLPAIVGLRRAREDGHPRL
eukprot:5475239-Pyramimonas_sp.AAC.1